jgi:hypothetical protein
MALTDFKTEFIHRYQDILNKTLVGLKVANTRYESGLKFGDTVTRFALDLSAVRVRAFSNLTDRTIDAITDSEQNMTVNVQVGAVFPIARLEKIQAGPLNPAMVAGKNIAIKVATYLDATILGETRNAFAAFDTGNLTTSDANGTPITLSSTTVPQMVMQVYAKLFANNAPMTNLCWVLDPYSMSAIGQFPIGKELSNEGTTFKNGYSGNIGGAEVYVSNNLTGEATLLSTGVFTDTQTITLGATPGNVLIGANAAATITNLAALINTPGTTTAQGVALSAADQVKITDTLRLTATATSATVLTIVGTGSSRLTLSETQTNASWATNFVHAYYGQKGAIDVAIQDNPEMEMREEAKQLTTNIFTDVVAAVKTFTDGSQYFLDVKIANA